MNPPPANLNCILLNDCGAAYNILPNTCTYVADQVYSPNVPYTKDQQTACGGTDLINAATVGQCPFGIVVAFRGTLPPTDNDPDSLFDWLQDFFAVPTSCTSGPNKIPGQVHSGFFDATTSIIQTVATLVKGLNPAADNPVYITGHSKGGAMASIGAYILAENLGIPNVQPLVTFASAKPGDINFHGGFQKFFDQTRYENYQDIVPLLPPANEFIDLVVATVQLIPRVGTKLATLFQSAEDWNYVPVGELKFITSSFQVITNESLDAQIWDVVKEFGEDLLKANFFSFVRAHILNPGNGYNSGVCGAKP